MELKPAVEKHTTMVNGSGVAYTARGPVNAEYAYVGINGLMGGGDSFWPVIAGVPQDWRVVLPDLPGCGESAPLLPPRKHSIDGYVSWLADFLDEANLANKKLVLASVATGAPIAIRFALAHRDSMAGLVLHLPFFGKPAVPTKWARPLVAYGLLFAPTRALVNRFRASDFLMHRIIIHEPPDAIPTLAESDIDHKQAASLHAAGEYLHDLMLTDARSELAQLEDLPVLILATEHDAFAPLPMLEAFVKNRHNITTYINRGAQHSWNEQFIAEMNSEIRKFTQAIIRRQADDEQGA
ncbi:MAG TPA: alpha/beta hydrolase [Chloroflexia bacterium]|nr:alpha/beta hydrolase [Chloroflexia bacterium]